MPVKNMFILQVSVWGLQRRNEHITTERNRHLTFNFGLCFSLSNCFMLTGSAQFCSRHNRCYGYEGIVVQHFLSVKLFIKSTVHSGFFLLV